MSPAGTATILIPSIKITKVRILPNAVIGYTSPYPTVVSVQTAHQRLWKID